MNTVLHLLSYQLGVQANKRTLKWILIGEKEFTELTVSRQGERLWKCNQDLIGVDLENSYMNQVLLLFHDF